MIQYIIPIIAAWLPIWQEYLLYIFFGWFVAVVGALLHFIFRR